MLQLPGMAKAQGRSLVDVARGGAADDAAVYFEALSGSLNRGWAPLTGVIANGMKYIDLPDPELYDLNADPQEARNLASLRPADVDLRRALLRTFPSGEVRPTDETAEVKNRLRALGYVTADRKDNAASGSGDDPKQAIATDNQLQQITSRYVSGDRAGALEESRALVAAHPDMRIALLQLSHLEREAGNLSAATASLRHALQIHPGDVEAASLLGATLTAANRSDDAIEMLEPYAAAADADVQVLVTLGLAQARSGRLIEARATLDRARRSDPSNTLLLVTSGTIELMAGLPCGGPESVRVGDRAQSSDRTCAQLARRTCVGRRTLGRGGRALAPRRRDGSRRVRDAVDICVVVRPQRAPRSGPALSPVVRRPCACAALRRRRRQGPGMAWPRTAVTWPM